MLKLYNIVITNGCAGGDNPRVIQLVVKSCVNVYQSVESATLRYFDLNPKP